MTGFEDIPVKYDLVMNAQLSREAAYVTIAHELAHLYCGHVGTPNPLWWPDRRGLKPEVAELEAESVAYMVCARRGIDNPSEKYLANLVEQQQDVPPLSLECVMKAAGLIETMSHMRVKKRKTPPRPARARPRARPRSMSPVKCVSSFRWFPSKASYLAGRARPQTDQDRTHTPALSSGYQCR